jgi:hypothetical protein
VTVCQVQAHRAERIIVQHSVRATADRPERRHPDLPFPDITSQARDGSLLLYQKVQPRVVMDLLGHTEIRTTLDLYTSHR